MDALLEKIDLQRFLYLLSFDTKLLKVMSAEEAHKLREEYLFINTVFQSSVGKSFTNMFRSAVIGKCSSLNGVILKKFPIDN